MLSLCSSTAISGCLHRLLTVRQMDRVVRTAFTLCPTYFLWSIIRCMVLYSVRMLITGRLLHTQLEHGCLFFFNQSSSDPPELTFASNYFCSATTACPVHGRPKSNLHSHTVKQNIIRVNGKASQIFTGCTCTAVLVILPLACYIGFSFLAAKTAITLLLRFGWTSSADMKYPCRQWSALFDCTALRCRGGRIPERAQTYECSAIHPSLSLVQPYLGPSTCAFRAASIYASILSRALLVSSVL